MLGDKRVHMPEMLIYNLTGQQLQVQTWQQLDLGLDCHHVITHNCHHSLPARSVSTANSKQQLSHDNREGSLSRCDVINATQSHQ